MTSLQQELRNKLIVMLIVVGSMTLLFARILIDQNLKKQTEQDLITSSQFILGAINRDASGHISLDQNRLPQRYQIPYSGYYFVIKVGEETFRSRSLWDLSLAQLEQPELPKGLIAAAEQQELLVTRQTFRRFSQPISITLAENYAPTHALLNRLSLFALGLGVLAIIVILLLQQVIIKRALQPLDQLKQQLLDLESGKYQRLDQSYPQELAPLVNQLNQLILHTEYHLAKSRTAIADLSHALKTPLAVLYTLIHSPDNERDKKIQQQLDSIKSRLERNLHRAQLNKNVLPSGHFIIERDLTDLLLAFKQLYGNNLKISLNSSLQGSLPLDREDMLELFGNLIDNACKHAKHQVSISLSKKAEELIFSVEDDGRGLSAKEQQHALARGVRLDQHTEGHGLGLAIVSDTVHYYSGQIITRTSELGGFYIEIRLPLNSSNK